MSRFHALLLLAAMGCRPEETEPPTVASSDVPPLVQFVDYEHYQEFARSDRSLVRMTAHSTLGAGCRCNEFAPDVPDRDLVELLLSTEDSLPMMDVRAHHGGKFVLTGRFIDPISEEDWMKNTRDGRAYLTRYNGELPAESPAGTQPVPLFAIEDWCFTVDDAVVETECAAPAGEDFVKLGWATVPPDRFCSDDGLQATPPPPCVAASGS